MCPSGPKYRGHIFINAYKGSHIANNFAGIEGIGDTASTANTQPLAGLRGESPTQNQRVRRSAPARKLRATLQRNQGGVIRIVVIGMGLLGGMLGRRWAELGRKAKALVAQIGPRGWLASAAKASPDAVVCRGLGRKLAFALLRQHS